MRGMERWHNKVALVTGASSGIGRAIALDLARSGMRVAAWGRRLERLEALQEADGVDPERYMATHVDLRDETSILKGFNAIRENWGGVDVMINNAGLGHSSPLTTGQSDHWREMLEVNVLALCICTREAVADMRNHGDDKGHVIHISSMAAHRVPPGSGVYSATKYAVRSLTEGLRQELRAMGSAIKVSAISPGFVETEFAEHYSKSAERAKETYSQYKVLDSEDVAEAVRYTLAQPPHVQVHDLLMRPTDQPT